MARAKRRTERKFRDVSRRRRQADAGLLLDAGQHLGRQHGVDRQFLAERLQFGSQLGRVAAVLQREQLDDPVDDRVELHRSPPLLVVGIADNACLMIEHCPRIPTRASRFPTRGDSHGVHATTSRRSAQPTSARAEIPRTSRSTCWAWPAKPARSRPAYKKKLRDGDAHGMWKARMRAELGDVLWYLATLADHARPRPSKTSPRPTWRRPAAGGWPATSTSSTPTTPKASGCRASASRIQLDHQRSGRPAVEIYLDGEKVRRQPDRRLATSTTATASMTSSTSPMPPSSAGRRYCGHCSDASARATPPSTRTRTAVAGDRGRRGRLATRVRLRVGTQLSSKGLRRIDFDFLETIQMAAATRSRRPVGRRLGAGDPCRLRDVPPTAGNDGGTVHFDADARTLTFRPQLAGRE